MLNPQGCNVGIIIGDLIVIAERSILKDISVNILDIRDLSDIGWGHKTIYQLIFPK